MQSLRDVTYQLLQDFGLTDDFLRRCRFDQPLSSPSPAEDSVGTSREKRTGPHPPQSSPALHRSLICLSWATETLKMPYQQVNGQFLTNRGGKKGW
jgi:hypothetical protein